MLALDHEIAVVIAAAIPAIGALILGLLVLSRQRVHGIAIDQINTAVNHQPIEGPTLVDRVTRLEVSMAHHIEWERAEFAWVSASLVRIANHVGAILPAPPEEGV